MNKNPQPADGSPMEENKLIVLLEKGTLRTSERVNEDNLKEYTSLSIVPQY